MIDRKSFLKLEPRRFIPDSELVSIGGNQYTTTFLDRKPSAAYQDRGGIDPTSISFSWDDATKTTTITTSSAPNENIFLDYFLYFTTSTVSYLQDDPVTPSGDLVRWEPRLSKHPSIPESASNMLNGVLSTSSTNVSIDNNDYALNKYLTKYDNYKNKQAVIYGKLGDNIKNLAFGYITSVKSGDKVSVNIKSSTKLLEASATLANSEQYYQYNATDYPLIDPTYYGKSIPVCYGYLSNVPKQGSIIDTGTAVVNLNQFYTDEDGFIEMPYIGNMTYVCGIVDNPWSRLSVEYASASYLGNDTWNDIPASLFSITSAHVQYLIAGELAWCFSATYPSGTRIPILNVDYKNSQILFKGSGIVDVDDIIIYPASCFAKNDTTSGSNALYLTPISSDVYKVSPDATFDFELTDSGQYLVKYRYTNATLFDIRKDRKHYCLLRSKDRTQSSFIKKYLNSINFNVDNTSFDQAQVDAPANVMITVNTEEIQSIHEIIENISTSCNGILFLDSTTNTYKYKIIDSSISGTDWYMSAFDILEPDLTPVISYNDTASIINMKHPYVEETLYIPNINSSRDNSFSRAINYESRSKTLEHYLTDSSQVIDLKAETFNTPMVTYKFTVMADDFFDIDIGDIVEISNTNGRILNSADSVRLLIVARTRSVEKIGLTGYEFTKIP